MADPKAFSQRALELISEAVGNILHPSFYERTLREIGVTIGREVVRHVRPSSSTTPPFNQDDYLRCLAWLKTHWGWSHDVTAARNGRVSITIPHCPFEKLSVHDPHLCQIEAGIVGGIAGDHFCYGKVEVSRGTGTPPQKCSLTVHLEQTPQSMIVEGPTFPLAYHSTKQPHTVTPGTQALNHLSPREWQILKLIGEGLSDKEIAKALHLSVRTVEGHAARIRAKTNLRTRSALIRLAVQVNTSS